MFLHMYWRKKCTAEMIEEKNSDHTSKNDFLQILDVFRF